MSETEPNFTNPEALRAHLCREPFVHTTELRALLGVGRTKFYRLIHSPGFPRPLAFGDGDDYRWFSWEIAGYLLGLPRVSHGPRSIPEPPSEDESPPVETRRRQRGERRRPARGAESPGAIEEIDDGVVVVTTHRHKRGGGR